MALVAGAWLATSLAPGVVGAQPVPRDEVSLTPTSGPPGTAITAVVRGCGGGDGTLISMYGPGVDYINYIDKATIVDGTVTLTFPAPDADPGTVFVSGLCAFQDMVYRSPDPATLMVTERRVREPVVATSRQGVEGWSVSAAGRVNSTGGPAGPSPLGGLADIGLNAPV